MRCVVCSQKTSDCTCRDSFRDIGARFSVDFLNDGADAYENLSKIALPALYRLHSDVAEHPDFILCACNHGMSRTESLFSAAEVGFLASAGSTSAPRLE